MVKLLLLRVATLRRFPLPVRFNDFDNRERLANGGSWRKNVCRPTIANQGWAIEWSSYFRHAAPPSGSFRFRSVQKSWITRERWQLDEKCLQITNSKRGRCIEWSSYFRHAAPPAADFPSECVLRLSKALLSRTR
jgi:hypothetical protein